jgi:hypothetical protein
MTMPRVLPALLACFALAYPIAAGAQSLGDIAKKEAERRKAAASGQGKAGEGKAEPKAAADKPPAKKVYTNADLKPAPAPAAGATPPAADAAKAAAEQKDAGKAAGEDANRDEKGEEYWHGRMATAREELRRNEMFRDALQTRINSLTNDFAARDDPYQRAQIADDRQKALAEMDRVAGEIDKLKKQIADIEEEARQAGVPPGWIR